MCPHDPQKNALKPWQQQQWVIPPQANAALVCAIEDGLEVYTRPYDPRRPQVCLDETSKPLVAETRASPSTAPGQPERVDYEYERKGTANLFMVCEPLAGTRQVKVTERRTAVDFAQLIQELVDVQYPQAEKIVLVLDNLNTHKPASLYEAFAPAEARRLAFSVIWRNFWRQSTQPLLNKYLWMTRNKRRVNENAGKASFDT